MMPIITAYAKQTATINALNLGRYDFTMSDDRLVYIFKKHIALEIFTDGDIRLNESGITRTFLSFEEAKVIANKINTFRNFK